MGSKAYVYLKLALELFLKLALCDLGFEDWVEFGDAKRKTGIFMVEH